MNSAEEYTSGAGRMASYRSNSWSMKTFMGQIAGGHTGVVKPSRGTR